MQFLSTIDNPSQIVRGFPPLARMRLREIVAGAHLRQPRSGAREFESFGAGDTSVPTSVDVEGVPRSQHGSGGLLDYPHYTRPAEFRGVAVPEVLAGGDHAAIRAWRRTQAIEKTFRNRPDLLVEAPLTAAERKLLEQLQNEQINRS